MVSFVCGSCQDVVKKPQINKHRCRNPSFSCVDCNTDFDAKSVQSHSSCISGKLTLFLQPFSGADDLTSMRRTLTYLAAS